MDRTTPPGAWPGTAVVACQNTASCPGAFYTLHDTSSQDFRVGLRWLFPAGGGIGLFPVAQAAFAPQQQYLLRRGLWRPGISDNRPGRCGRQVLSALRNRSAPDASPVASITDGTAFNQRHAGF